MTCLSNRAKLFTDSFFDLMLPLVDFPVLQIGTYNNPKYNYNEINQTIPCPCCWRRQLCFVGKIALAYSRHRGKVH